MPPKSVAEGSSGSTSNCRSKRQSNRIKSMLKGQSESSKKEQPSSTKRKGIIPCRKKSNVTGPSASSKEERSASTKRNPRKRRRLIKMDEVHERVSQFGLEEQEDFSTAIEEILKELSPNLEISKEAIAYMNTYLNHVFERLARQSAIIPLGRNRVIMTVEDVEAALPHVIEGDLVKFCINEGRRAVKKWNELRCNED